MFYRFAACVVLVVVVGAQCWSRGDALPKACRLSGDCFGIIHELAESIVVRSAKGDVRISSTRPDDPMRGAIVEVFGPGDSSQKHAVETDARGRFKIKGLQAGEYSFHVRASGFNSVVGRFTISKHAAQKNKLHIEMTLGV
jgi:hypothetical protein